jgi:hypothetical protein
MRDEVGRGVFVTCPTSEKLLRHSDVHNNQILTCKYLIFFIVCSKNVCAPKSTVVAA